MTVSELIARLSKLPQDEEVGVATRSGECSTISHVWFYDEHPEIEGEDDEPKIIITGWGRLLRSKPSRWRTTKDS